MSKNIHIHIGNFKTGTSAIQEYCSNIANKLLVKGLLYPDGNRPSNNNTNHGRLALSLFEKHGGSPPRWYQDKADFNTEVKAVKKEINDAKATDILISSEEFWRIPTLENPEKAIQELLSHFSEHNISIILYHRPPFSFCKSWYNQTTKGGFNGKSFLDFILEVPLTYLTPNSNYALWKKYISPDEIKIKLYQKSGDAHITEFLSLLDVDFIEYKKNNDTTPVNSSIPTRHLEQQRILSVLRNIKNMQNFRERLKTKALQDREKWEALNHKIENINNTYLTFLTDHGIDYDFTPETLFDYVSHFNQCNTLNINRFLTQIYPEKATNMIVAKDANEALFKNIIKNL